MCEFADLTFKITLFRNTNRTMEMTIATNGSEAADESDDYLMELMGIKQDFPKEALDAYGKIYFRYWDVMLEIARRVAKDDDTAQDLLSDTFNMVYNKAGTFDKGKLKRPENIRLCIQKWMTVIMQHIFYDNYLDEAYKKPSDNENREDSFIIDRKSVKKHLSDDFDDFVDKLGKDESTESPDENIEESENLTRIKDYIGKLSERDRDIIFTVYNYYIPGKYTPSEVLDDIEKRWGTTRQNIRKILEKFRKSIKETLQSQLFIRK